MGRQKRQRTVFYVSAKAVAEGASHRLLGTPFIINENGQPEDQINEYLFARRNGDWRGSSTPGGLLAEASGVRVLRASLKYLRNRVYHLDAFRRWCRTNRVVPIDVTEAELEWYGDSLEEENGGSEGVRPQTVNQYLTSIIDFLCFGFGQGWRKILGLARRETRMGPGKFLLIRIEDIREIEVWYSEEEIESFIEEFETSAAKLAAWIMYKLGLRISETLSRTTTSFPTPEQCRSDRARRTIRVTGKRNTTRFVPIDEKICGRVHKFINFDRERYAYHVVKETDILILGPKPDRKFGPMTPRYLQKEFARVRLAVGKSELTPHILRHHFAAHYLLRAWRAKSPPQFGHFRYFDLGAAQTLLSVELLTLKDALGHSALETTMHYLKAISYLMGADLAEDYAAGLEGAQ